jgi:death-on-curing protein
MTDSPRYLTVDELVYINEQIRAEDAIHTIVEGKRAVREMGRLEAAAARPMASAFGADAYPTLPEKAAALLHSITRNHPFADGNKRTGTTALIFFLEVNGQSPRWEAAEALRQIVALAEGYVEMEAFAAWLPLHPTESQPHPDHARDVEHLAQIMRDHHWLLDALAKT